MLNAALHQTMTKQQMQPLLAALLTSTLMLTASTSPRARLST